jgi:hypothetical protein
MPCPLMISLQHSSTAMQSKDIRLGKILLRKGFITSCQLENALQSQQETPFRLGELLLQKGWLTEEQLKQALQEQYWRKEGFWVIADASKDSVLDECDRQ